MNIKTAISVNVLLRWLIRSPVPDLHGFRHVTRDEARDAAAWLAKVVNHTSNSHGQSVPDEKTVMENFPSKPPRTK